MSNFEALQARARQQVEEAHRSHHPEAYAALAMTLAEWETQLREHLQATVRVSAQALISKLSGGQTLSAADAALLRTLIIGDAESYVRVEHNLPDWLVELQRLMGELVRLGGGVPDVAMACQVRALVRDAVRVVADLQHYFEHKARVAQFEEATRELDREERDVLVGFLKQKLASPEF